MITQKLKTNRLILRGIKSDDVFGCFEILSDTETMILYGGVGLSSDLEIANFISTIRKQEADNIGFFWSIITQLDKEFIGFIKLMNYESSYFDMSYAAMGELRNSPEFKEYVDRKGWEINYVLLKEYRGFGYMTEAINAIVEFATIENLNPIYAKVVSISNKSTIRVLQKNNFSELIQTISDDSQMGMLYKRDI